MSASSPGPVRRFFRGAWRVVDISRRVVLNLLFLIILVVVIVALVKSGPLPLADKTALVLRIDGTIGEQKTGTLRSTALDQVRGEAIQKVQLRDILNALDAAASDAKISSLVVVLDEMRPTGFSTLREIAAAIDRFKASGKKVVAWGSTYDQRQYYIASHADEVLLHPLGMVHIAGFGSLRNYYKDALDKLGVTVNVIRVGTFKSAVEPFIANEPSAPALEADRVLYGGLWKTYVDAVEKERKLPRRIDHARHRRGAAAPRRGRRRRRQARPRREARRRAEDARRAARAHDRARRQGRRRQHLPPDLVRRLPRPRQAEADRRCDRRRRRRGRDRRRQRAGGNDRRRLDREPDQEGARQQGRQGARPARRFARRQRLRLRARPARARGDPRRRQAGRRLDGQRRCVGRLLDLDRLRRDRRRRGDDHRLDRRLRAPAERRPDARPSSASTRPASARRGCSTPTTRACRSTRAWPT